MGVGREVDEGVGGVAAAAAALDDEVVDWLGRVDGRAGSGCVCGFETGIDRGAGGGLIDADSGGSDALITIGVAGWLAAPLDAHEAVGGSVPATTPNGQLVRPGG